MKLFTRIRNLLRPRIITHIQPADTPGARYAFINDDDTLPIYTSIGISEQRADQIAKMLSDAITLHGLQNHTLTSEHPLNTIQPATTVEVMYAFVMLGIKIERHRKETFDRELLQAIVQQSRR